MVGVPPSCSLLHVCLSVCVRGGARATADTEMTSSTDRVLCLCVWIYDSMAYLTSTTLSALLTYSDRGPAPCSSPSPHNTGWGGGICPRVKAKGSVLLHSRSWGLVGDVGRGRFEAGLRTKCRNFLRT